MKKAEIDSILSSGHGHWKIEVSVQGIDKSFRFTTTNSEAIDNFRSSTDLDVKIEAETELLNEFWRTRELQED
jgi:hypothetical protein